MYPRNRSRALSAQMSAETAMSRLVETAFHEWLPHARAAVLPSLTASAVLPPDPAAIVTTVAQWEAALDGTVLNGVGLVYGFELFTVMEAAGEDTVPLEETDDEVEEPSPRDERVHHIVASALGVETAAITALAKRIERTPTVRTLQQQYLADVRNRMVGTPESVFRDISTDLDRGLAAGESIDQMRSRVQSFLSSETGDWPGRAATVARTETAGAMSAATVQAATLRNDLLGEELEQTWICTLDSRTRRTHWAADGQRVKLGSKFRLGRHDVRYPGDPAAPVEETANCRCRVAVLAVDEKLPGEGDRHTERGQGDSTVRNREGSQADEIARRAEDGNVRAREDPDGLGRVASAQPTEENPMDFRTFTDSVIAVLGTPTDDRRILAGGMDLSFREFPLPLMWTRQSGIDHMDAFTVGVLESARVEGDQVLASGYLLNTAEADEAADQIAHGVTGPSVDLGNVDWMFTDENGVEVTEEQWWEDDGSLTIYETVTAARLLGVTLVSTPAFGQTTIALDAERSPRDVGLVASLVAGAPRTDVHAAALFADPQLDGPTPLTYDKSTGRIYGHLAAWNTCHVGITDRCVTAPKSLADYAHFHTSPPVDTDAGKLAVGRLTAGTGHAGPRASASAAAEHYDNTGTCFALVRAGEDEHGIWVSGIPNPVATDDQVTAGMSAPLSGDWRTRGGNLELVAALAVNTPGFPILVASGATDHDDAPLSLVASLAPRPKGPTDRRGPSAESIARAVVAEMRAQDRRNDEAKQIVGRRSARNRDAAMALIAGREVK